MGTVRTGLKYLISKNPENSRQASRIAVQCRSIRILCITNGIEYGSMKIAADELGLHQSKISVAIKTGGNVKGYQFKKLINP